MSYKLLTKYANEMTNHSSGSSLVLIYIELSQETIAKYDDISILFIIIIDKWGASKVAVINIWLIFIINIWETVIGSHSKM